MRFGARVLRLESSAGKGLELYCTWGCGFDSNYRPNSISLDRTKKLIPLLNLPVPKTRHNLVALCTRLTTDNAEGVIDSRRLQARFARQQ